MSGADVLADLSARGLVHDTTDRESLERRLDTGPTTAYCGFDPTADSLHIGNLQSIMLLRRLQRAGHPPIALVGGATGMIGDPSGRTDERQFLDEAVLDANRAAIGEQLRGLLDFEDAHVGARLVDNRTWTEPMGVLEFLRDVGKHITVNTMLAKDSVKGRIERESGISFTEFSYMLLQAHDFFALHRDHGCDLQVAGSDQWGNITAGIDLVRRRTGDTVHGLTAPLITRADGTKFGKSEGANVWLSATRTSPYQLYQYFVGVADPDVEPMLLRLTLVPVDECRAIAASHAEHPGRRDGQRRLARELVALIHGERVVEPVERAAAVLFGGPLDDVDSDTFDLLAAEIPTTAVARDDLIGADPLEWFVRSNLAKSKGEVRKNLPGHYVNAVSLAERESNTVETSDLLHGQFVVLRRGKTAYHLLVVR